MLISKFDNCDVETEIEKLEKKYMFTFSKQYRKFLIKYNGGKTPNTNFRINKVSSDLNFFYGFGEVDKNYNYQTLEKNHNFKGWLGDYMLPIGQNDFGDYIMLGVGDENSGQVFFYYHDKGKRYLELTKDFISFIQKCKSKKIGHIRTLEERRQGMIENGLGSEVSAERLSGWQAEIDEYKNINKEELILD